MKHTTAHVAQRGFLLVQMAIVVTLLSIVIGYTANYYWQTKSRDIADDRARLVGSTMAATDDAAKTYMTTFFSQIQRGQAVTKGAYTVPVARVLTPTPADLRELGMLAARSAGTTVYNGQAINFAVAITVDTSGGCVIPTCNLRSTVSSSVPMLDPRTGQADIRRATIAAATASPGNAGVAMPTSMGGNPALFVSHAGNQVALNASGTAGVIGMANGYDSAGFMEFDRRDGSLPRTGSINMQDVMGTRHDINRAGAVGALTVTAEGRIKTSEYLDLDGPVVTEGTACDKDGLVARAAGGLILSCQSGVWSSIDFGSNFKGNEYSLYLNGWSRTYNGFLQGKYVPKCPSGWAQAASGEVANIGSAVAESWAVLCTTETPQRILQIDGWTKSYNGFINGQFIPKCPEGWIEVDNNRFSQISRLELEQWKITCLQ